MQDEAAERQSTGHEIPGVAPVSAVIRGLMCITLQGGSIWQRKTTPGTFSTRVRNSSRLCARCDAAARMRRRWRALLCITANSIRLRALPP